MRENNQGQQLKWSPGGVSINEKLTSLLEDTQLRELNLTEAVLKKNNFIHAAELLSNNQHVEVLQIRIIDRKIKSYSIFLNNVISNPNCTLKSIFIHTDKIIRLDQESFDNIFNALALNKSIQSIEFNGFSFESICENRLLKAFAKIRSEVECKLNVIGISTITRELLPKWQGTHLNAEPNPSASYDDKVKLDPSQKKILAKPLNPKAEASVTPIYNNMGKYPQVAFFDLPNIQDEIADEGDEDCNYDSAAENVVKFLEL